MSRRAPLEGGHHLQPPGSNEHRRDDGRPHVVVGLLADEGMPSRVAEDLAAELPAVLTDSLSGDVTWAAEHRSESLSLDEHGNIPLEEVVARQRQLGWDITILLTDLPRREGTHPIVSDYSVDSQVGVLSMPALGVWRIRRRARTMVIHLLSHLLHDRLDSVGPCTSPAGSGPVRHISSQHEHVDEHLALAGARGRARLLAGMILDNRPWRLVPHLAGATAAAAATAAYGVVTTSFWNMADALAPWRLAVINVVAIAAMTVWLLLYNRLWERHTSKADRERALMYNVSTLVTLAVGVTCMYAILFGVTVLAAFAVIDSGYLSSQLGHSGSLAGYASIAWLASSIGVVAGALGSSFESEEAVRKATYGKRERERQRTSTESPTAGNDDQRNGRD